MIKLARNFHKNKQSKTKGAYKIHLNTQNEWGQVSLIVFEKRPVLDV